MTGSVPDGKFGNKAPGFDSPIRLPDDENQRCAWQEANKAWWEDKPMRYDWREGLASDKETRDFFREIDERFLLSVEKFLPSRSIPFDALIRFDTLGDRDVLEIGMGHGSVGQLLAQYARSYTGIDLTEEATNMTRRRFTFLNKKGTLLRMDAEAMTFPDASFDFVWSWGVIHHSADTSRILKEMHRVLRPNGQAIVMVYYRSWWSYYLFSIMKLLLEGKFPTSDRIDKMRQRTTDGAIARFYTRCEWKKITNSLFSVTTSVHGMSIELIPLPHGRVKNFLLRILPDRMARFMTHQLAMGSFLVAHMAKK